MVLVAVACTVAAATPSPTPQRPSPPPPPPAPTVIATPDGEGNGPCPAGTQSAETRVVGLQDVGGSGAYQFSPSEFTFSVGQTVTFTLSAETEFHTFTVDDLGIDCEMDPGETATFTFTFSEAGTFPLICIPHQINDMVGTIRVQ